MACGSKFMYVEVKAKFGRWRSNVKTSKRLGGGAPPLYFANFPGKPNEIETEVHGYFLVPPLETLTLSYARRTYGHCSLKRESGLNGSIPLTFNVV